MSLAYIGKLSLGAILPASVTAIAAASLGLSDALPVLSADLAGAVTCSAQIAITPPNLAAQIASVAVTATGLALAVTLGVPFVDLQAPELGAQVAILAPAVADITAGLALTLPLAALFGEQGVSAWSFAGTSAQFGALAPAALPDGSDPRAPVTGFVLASTAGATWTGLQTFFPPIPGSQPSSSLVPLGVLSVGTLVGIESAGVLAANASLQVQLGRLNARLQGALAFQAALVANPPTLAGNVALVGQLAANLGAYVSANYITPTAALAAVAALVAKLTADVAALTAQVSALASITAALGTAGVLAFTYTGTAEGFPAAVSAAVGAGWPDGTPSSSPSNALVILASGSGTAAALSTLFGGL
jgi:hypothetical protein